MKAIFVNHHIGTNPLCPIRHNYLDDISHLLFECSSAQHLWKELKLEERIMASFAVDRSGSEMMEELLESSSNQYRGLQNVGVAEVIAIAC